MALGLGLVVGQSQFENTSPSGKSRLVRSSRNPKSPRVEYLSDKSLSLSGPLITIPSIPFPFIHSLHQFNKTRYLFVILQIKFSREGDSG
jgi:hypothetical protein